VQAALLLLGQAIEDAEDEVEDISHYLSISLRKSLTP
jgi:hypothetical protein